MANQTYPRPPWDLQPWRLSGELTPTRTRGEIGFNRNGTALDIWIRIDGEPRWFGVEFDHLLQSLAHVSAFSLTADSDRNAEVSEV